MAKICPFLGQNGFEKSGQTGQKVGTKIVKVYKNFRKFIKIL